MRGPTIRFHGSAGTVTGSCLEISGASKRILVDCGLFQGTRTLEALNHQPLPFDPTGIDAVILSHAHLDHSGRLPYLVKSGCRAPVWCTRPTSDIFEPLLLDAAKLQAADCERRNRRPDRARARKFEPLYTPGDVAATVAQLRPIDYCEWLDIGDGCGFRLWDARHIVGSASVELVIDGQRILISGDIGEGRPIGCEGVDTGGYDHIICESTYGDRVREPVLLTARREQLAQHIETVTARGGNLLIPAFAVERTQAVLDDIVALLDNGRLKSVDVFVDSPLAEKITRATLRYRQGSADFFRHDSIRFVHDAEESKLLKAMSGGVIIAGSGMCTGGRIRYHLIHNLPRAESRVLMVGFQVAGSLGAVLRDGARHVRISGSNVEVVADVHSLDSYSAHADQKGLLEWLKARGPVQGNVFLVHGEETALKTLSNLTAGLSGFPHPIIPALGDCWRLGRAVQTRRLDTALPDARRFTSPSDWHGQLAALKAGLDDRIAKLPSDRARQRTLASLSRTIERAERR